MELPSKRRAVTRTTVRNAWLQNLQWVDDYGFCEYVREAIEDDHEDLRICWCCGVTGYQEVAHIIAHSLGGTHLPFNCFLLCAECHLNSPDCSSAKYFVAFTNENAGRFSRVLAETFKKINLRVIEFCQQEPEQAKGLVESMQAANLDFSGRATTHGANYSISTKMARLEMVLDEAIDRARLGPAET
ncbi:HNH endonuclease [Pseudomonas fluorescens]|uniref:HNH endonuclease n=1 Tax=Pseudomonas fluorescens TaxID=294 RepID=UPI0009369BCD|nr:HNH endonuclease [Pseudomonas fluorescens]